MTETKRLYTVSVEFEIAVYAKDESDARWQARDAAHDEFYNATVIVSPTVHRARGFKDLLDVARPHGWDGESLVYGTDKDTTLDDAIAAEKKRLEDEAIAEKQAELFTKEKP
jgi:hypothetical protein